MTPRNSWFTALQTLAYSYASREGDDEAVLMLSIDAGLSIEEIAEVMGLSTAEVAKIIDNYC